jgi:hypothetical protein
VAQVSFLRPGFLPSNPFPKPQHPTLPPIALPKALTVFLNYSSISKHG